MPESPFGFLLELTEDQGKEWLRRYLGGKTTLPSVRIPSDLRPLEFLLGEVNPMPDEALPLRVGTLAGGLLAEAIAEGAHRTGDPRWVEALFTLAGSLPVSEDITEFITDLAVTGRLLESQRGAGLDLHLVALRALVAHQRPVQGSIDRLIAFWERELDDLRYAPIAIQGLLRISVAAAIRHLPGFIRRAQAAHPPVPLVNTLFSVSIELGTDTAMWDDLVRAFDGYKKEFEALRETYGQTRFPERNPRAWEVLQTPPQPHPVPARFARVYSRPDDPGIQSAWANLDRGLLEPREQMAA
ncbi:MAG: hypothetical protein HY726_10120 [Candidatus Rokubacteria bacterium]|nr:hypothetical protein [Candidatus Rokubacteria bacterium]